MTQSRISRGLIMVVVLLLLPICVMLGATMLSNTFAERHFLRYERERGQSFYMAELGLNAGYYSFASSVFGGYTHRRLDLNAPVTQPGEVVSQAGSLSVDPAILQQLPFTRVTGGPFQGWYEYHWAPGDDRRSLTGSGMEEIIRFRVTQTGLPTSEGRPGTWEVVSQAHLGPIVKTHRLSGTIRGLHEFTIFDSGDLNEFIQSSDRVVRGLIHANGDLYLKPSEANLSIITSSFTAGGNIWYGRDATGRTNMGTVRLGETSTTLSAWPTNFDSFSSDWLERAISIWDGIVRDHQLGAPVMGIPSAQTFEPGGFYDLKAREDGLQLSLAGGNITVNGAYAGGSNFPGLLSTVEFYNHSEERIVRAILVDVANLEASHYPNGLIYSESPLVLKNAAVLPQDTSMVSQSAIYTLGDFNKEIATLEDYQIRTDSSHPDFDPLHTTKVSAALMTKDRVWHLSSEFDLSLSPAFSPNANNPEAFPGNNAWVNRATLHGGRMVIEINALTLTGAPLYGESFNRDSQGKVNTGPNKPNGQVTRWDAYLEHFTGQKVLKKRGSLIFLNQGTLADIDDPNPPEGFVAWYRRVAYNPPAKDFDYDEMLRLNPPPFVPYVANRTLWKRF